MCDLNIDDHLRAICYYSETATIVMDDNNICELSFKPEPRLVMVDNTKQQTSDLFVKSIWSSELNNGLSYPLKELYTSETTLAQKIVLTPLNNKFKLKIWNTTSFMLKNPPEFLKKIHKNQFSASWRGLMVFIHIYKVVYF